MSAVSFEIDFLALLYSIVFIGILLFLGRGRAFFQTPKIFVSNFHDLQVANRSWKVRYAKLPRYLEFLALGFFLAALIDPHLQIPKKTKLATMPEKGIAIYLVADQSGSMSEKTSGGGQHMFSGHMTKIELLKKMAQAFVQGDPEHNLKGRENDLIGLIGFARSAHVIVPLTLDHNQVLEAISRLNVVQDKDQDGTAMGYAIFKTVNIIAATRHYTQDLAGADIPAYNILSSVIVVITDGFQSPNPKDENNPLRSKGLEEAAEYAKEKGVRLYIFNVEPAFMANEFLPHRHLLERITEMTGGKFYIIQDTTQLGIVYDALASLQKSLLPPESANLLDLPKDLQPNRYRRESFYPLLIACGLISLLLSILFDTTVLRRIP